MCSSDPLRGGVSPHADVLLHGLDVCGEVTNDVAVEGDTVLDFCINSISVADFILELGLIDGILPARDNSGADLSLPLLDDAFLDVDGGVILRRDIWQWALLGIEFALCLCLGILFKLAEGDSDGGIRGVGRGDDGVRGGVLCSGDEIIEGVERIHCGEMGVE